MTALKSAVLPPEGYVPVFDPRPLVGGIIHELRNPVFAMGVTVDALEQRLGDTSELQQYFGALRYELERILQLANELGALVVPLGQYQATSIKELLNRVIQDLQSIAQTQQVNISTQIAADIAPVVSDAVRLQTALLRLIGFAIVRTPKGGEVSIQVAPQSHDSVRQVQIDIHDGGAPLESRAIRDVLLPFGVRRGGKLTLDIAIANIIVVAHGGTMSAHNDEAGGLCFTVTLPNNESAITS